MNSFKYLGVVGDNKRCFKQHIDHVCKKLAKFNGILYKARIVFSRRFLLRFHQVYAKILILYGILLNGCASKTNLSKILLTQKRTLRTIFFRRKFDQSTEKFSEYIIDKFFELIVDTVFKEVIYQILGKLPLKFRILIN